MSDIDIETGAAVRAFRKERKMTQGAMAFAMGKLSRNFISQLESGQRGWSLHLLVKAASALGVSPQLLVPVSPAQPQDADKKTA